MIGMVYLTEERVIHLFLNTIQTNNLKAPSRLSGSLGLSLPKRKKLDDVSATAILGRAALQTAMMDCGLREQVGSLIIIMAGAKASVKRWPRMFRRRTRTENVRDSKI